MTLLTKGDNENRNVPELIVMLMVEKDNTFCNSLSRNEVIDVAISFCNS